MALITSTDGLISAAQLIESFQGTMELDFDSKKVIVKSDKLAKAPIKLPVSGGGYNGYRMLGSSFAVTGTLTDLTGSGRIITDFHNEDGSATITVDAAIGKVDLEAGDDTTSNIKNANIFEGLAVDEDLFSEEQGVIIFGRVTGTSVNIREAGFAVSDGSISGGTGTALLVEGDNEMVVRLDEVAYPITPATADGFSIEPLGSSVLFN